MRRPLFFSFISAGLNPFFLDTGFLAPEFPHVEDPCPANNTVLVNIDLVDKRGGERENSFNSDIP